jgi:hypothetical protein
MMTSIHPNLEVRVLENDFGQSLVGIVINIERSTARALFQAALNGVDGNVVVLLRNYEAVDCFVTALQEAGENAWAQR